MSIFDQENGGNTTSGKAEGGDKGAQVNSGTTPSDENHGTNDSFVKTTDADGKVTLTDANGNQVTNIPADKVDPNAAPKKVEYTAEVMALIPEKFKNAPDPVKAWQEGHKGLEQKLRSNEKAVEVPEEYKPTLPKAATDIGIELNKEDPRYKKYVELAKAKGFSQEQFDAGLESYFEGEVSAFNNKKAEMDKLGKEGVTMLKETKARLVRELGDDEANAILNEITTASGAQALSKLLGNLKREASIPGQSSSAQNITEGDELSDYRQRLKDPRMKSDKDFRKETMAMGERMKEAIEQDVKRRGVIGSRATSAQ